MGITGLIPFLEKAKATKPGNISQFAGGTVAIDSYCWLHKGAFSCADKIAMGQPTDAYVKYCMRFVHMLLANRIKPILVFDGRHLPAKKETEVKRRENREATRRQAAELMRMGQTAEGRNLLRRSVDITHEMALELIKKCQDENVDCIVAPYEADAQLAYLNISGIADVVITEDSDLTLFGCLKIFFKMDLNGNGVLVEQDRLHLAMNVRAEHFDIDKFRHMCILSGCDYLASLPGIGLSKACKFIAKNVEADIHKALTRLGSYLNMKNLVVTDEYRDAFVRALVTFKHQLVYCPLQRKQVRLNPPSPDVTDDQLHFAGNEVSEDVAWQLALGNCEPFTMKELHNFDPDRRRKHRGRTNSWHEKPGTGYVSIWSNDFKVRERKNEKASEITKWPDTAGRVIVLNTDSIKNKTLTPKKRNFEELAEELSANDMLSIYGTKKLQKNDATANERSTPPPRPEGEDKSSPSGDEESTSPILSRRSNPFAKPTNAKDLSPSLVRRGKRRIKLKNFVGFRATVIDEKVVQQSKYFNSNSASNEASEKIVTDCAKILDFQEEEIPEITRENARNIRAKPENAESENDETSSSSGIFLSQESRDRDLSPERNSCDLGPSIAIETLTRGNDDNFNDLDKLLDSKCDIVSQVARKNSRPEDDESNDYAIRGDSNASLRCNFFQWANPKITAENSATGAGSKPPKRTTVVAAKTKTTRKTTLKKPTTSESQQSLLNMFGFQKKTVLKH